MNNKLRVAAEAALEALAIAEAGLSDIGDADREPGDNIEWCERRAAITLPATREAISRLRAALAEQDDYEDYRLRIERLVQENLRLREANEAFDKRQEWWNARMIELEAENGALKEKNRE